MPKIQFIDPLEVRKAGEVTFKPIPVNQYNKTVEEVSVAAIIAGGSILGPIGIILALPFAAIVQALISTSIHRHEVLYKGREEVASD
jgi:hypothetical protein